MKMIASSWSLCILVFSAIASADPNAAASKPDNYQYGFTDDPVNAGLFGANEPRIIVRPGAGRGTLIRPRIAFVVEMLKSVEAL